MTYIVAVCHDTAEQSITVKVCDHNCLHKVMIDRELHQDGACATLTTDVPIDMRCDACKKKLK